MNHPFWSILWYCLAVLNAVLYFFADYEIDGTEGLIFLALGHLHMIMDRQGK